MNNPDRMSDKRWEREMDAIRRERHRPSSAWTGLLAVGILGVVMAFIYGLVKFVQWAWYN